MNSAFHPDLPLQMAWESLTALKKSIRLNTCCYVFDIKVKSKRLLTFVSYLIERDECWIWIGGKTHNGYGTFGIGGRKGINTRAHRFVFALRHGKISEDAMVLHRCNNRDCCNPAHLYEGDAQENAYDRIIAGNSTGGPSRKVTKEDVEKMKQLREAGLPNTTIGAKLGISNETVRLYLNVDHPKHFSFDEIPR